MLGVAQSRDRHACQRLVALARRHRRHRNERHRLVDASRDGTLQRIDVSEVPGKPLLVVAERRRGQQHRWHMFETLVQDCPCAGREVVGLVEDHQVEEVAGDGIHAGIAVAQHHRGAHNDVPIAAAFPDFTVAAVVGTQYLRMWRRVEQRPVTDRLLELAELVGNLVAHDARGRDDEDALGFEDVRREHGDEGLADTGREDNLRRLLGSGAMRRDSVQRTALRFSQVAGCQRDGVSTKGHLDTERSCQLNRPTRRSRAARRRQSTPAR